MWSEGILFCFVFVSFCVREEKAGADDETWRFSDDISCNE